MNAVNGVLSNNYAQWAAIPKELQKMIKILLKS